MADRMMTSRDPERSKLGVRVNPNPNPNPLFTVILLAVIHFACSPAVCRGA